MAAHTTTLAHQLAEAGHDVTLVSWSHLYPSRLYPGEQAVPGGTPDVEPFPRTVRALSWARPDTWVRTGRRLRDFDAVVVVHVIPAVVPAHLALLRAAGSGRAATAPAPRRRGGPQRAAARAAPWGQRADAHLPRAGRRGAGPLGRAGPDRPRPRGAARLGRRPSPAPARRRPGRAAPPRRPDQAAGPGHRARVQGSGPAHARPGPGARPHPDRGRRDVGGRGCRGHGTRPGPEAARAGPGPRRLRPRRPPRPDAGQPRRAGADLPFRHRLPERAPRPAARPARARLRGGHLRRPGPRRGGRPARAPR